MATLTYAHARTAAHRGLAFSLADMFAVWRQRRTLATLDDTRLDDLGLTRAEALREAARPAWDLRP